MRPPLIPRYLPPPKRNLRPYQEKGLSDIDGLVSRGHRKILVAGAPGSGKTSLMSAYARRAYNQGMKTTIFVPFNCVVTKSSTDLTQMCGALAASGLSGCWGVYSGAFPDLEKPKAPIQIVTLQTLQSRKELHQWLADSDVILIDEGHSASFFKEVEKVYAEWQWKIIINFTATPFNRSQGKDDRHGDLERNTGLVRLPSYYRLQSEGHLASLTYHSLHCDVQKGEKLDLTSDSAIETMLLELPKDLRYFVGFCKAKHKGFSQMTAIKRIGESLGIPFEIVDESCSQDDYEKLMIGFERGQFNFLNVHRLSTGWDCPRTEHVGLFREIGSRDRYAQIIGRCDRVHPKKLNGGHIWDFAQNVDLGCGGKHPKIELLYESIDSSVLMTKAKAEGQVPMKSCVKCRKSILSFAIVCKYCKTVQPESSVRMIDPATGQLVSSISELSARSSQDGAVAYFRQWRKNAYIYRWKPFAAMLKCQEIGVTVPLDDSTFWLGSIFGEPEDVSLRRHYRKYLEKHSEDWQWDSAKVERELQREFHV